MSFIEKYIIEPFKYAISDRSKVLIGGSLLFFNIVVDWILSILLGPLSLIIIPGITLTFTVIILGYCIGVTKNTLKGLDTLPDWNTEIVKDGVLYIVALFILNLVVYLPVTLLLIMGLFDTLGGLIGHYSGGISMDGALYAGTLFISNLVVYLSVTLLLTVGLFSTLGGLTGYLTYLLSLYMLVALIVLTIYIPIATVNFAKKGFFEFFKVFDVFKKISLEYIGILLYTVLGIGAVIIFIITAVNIFASLLYLIYPLGVLILLFVILVISIMDFILWVISFRAVAKYYLEREIKNKKLLFPNSHQSDS